MLQFLQQIVAISLLLLASQCSQDFRAGHFSPIYGKKSDANEATEKREPVQGGVDVGNGNRDNIDSPNSEFYLVLNCDPIAALQVKCETQTELAEIATDIIVWSVVNDDGQALDNSQYQITKLSNRKALINLNDSSISSWQIVATVYNTEGEALDQKSIAKDEVMSKKPGQGLASTLTLSLSLEGKAGGESFMLSSRYCEDNYEELFAGETILGQETSIDIEIPKGTSTIELWLTNDSSEATDLYLSNNQMHLEGTNIWQAANMFFVQTDRINFNEAAYYFSQDIEANLFKAISQNGNIAWNGFVYINVNSALATVDVNTLAGRCKDYYSQRN